MGIIKQVSKKKKKKKKKNRNLKEGRKCQCKYVCGWIGEGQ